MAADRPSPDRSRARARKAVESAPSTASLAKRIERTAQSEREAHVQETIALMRAGSFITGVTGPELAARWGMAASSVVHICAEASRRVCAEVTDPHIGTFQAMRDLDELKRDAMREAREPALIDGGGDKGVYQESPNGARKVAIEAIKVQLAVVAGRSGSFALPSAWPTLSPAEQWAKIDDAEAFLARIKADMPPRE